MGGIIAALAGTVIKSFIDNGKLGTVLRNGLTVGGGLLAGTGISDATQSMGGIEDLAYQIQAILGGIFALLGIYASFKARYMGKD